MNQNYIRISNFRPMTGRKAPGKRFRFRVRKISRRDLYLPLLMKNNPKVRALLDGADPCYVFNTSSPEDAKTAFRKLRLNYDFTYWAYTRFPVRDIEDPDNIVPFFFNTFQRKIIDAFETAFFNKIPGRFIISKSFRRCGVTTCVQAYILWRQIYSGWRVDSNICGASARNLLHIKENLCRFLKRDIIPAGKRIFIPAADCCSDFNSLRTPDALRGINFAYLHFVDMGKWNDPYDKKTSRVFAGSFSGILPDHHTLVVLEGDVPKDFPYLPSRYYTPTPKKLPPFSTHIEDYARYSRNPCFLRQIAYSATTKSPPFHHIHL